MILLVWCSVGVFPLRKIKVLERCSEECLASIVLLLRTHVFMPGDWVCRVGEVGKELYYCSKGQVEVITREDDPNPPKMTVGAFFGIRITYIPPLSKSHHSMPCHG
jgi:hypothetical protein